MNNRHSLVMLLTACIVWIAVCSCGSAAGDPWSERMARSMMRDHPDTLSHIGEKKQDRWTYEQGVLLEAIRQVWERTGDPEYFTYIRKNIDRFVREDGTIRTYEFPTFNIDNVPTGRLLIPLFFATGEPGYRRAADTLRKQLAVHPRTSDGGFWHKKIYPFQMWLDGLYMGEPFYALYAQAFGEPRAFDDIHRQFVLMERHARDSATGLLYHAWDESRTQRWADPATGRSRHFWARAIGWYAMALVDVLDAFPADHPGRADLIGILRRLAPAVLKFRDPATRTWYQVMDLGNRKGNYFEASASCMFTYAFAKGARLGYLDSAYFDRARESFEGIVRTMVAEQGDGTVSLLHTCQGAGLGGDPYRDGSYEYYIGEPQRVNDFKGVGPFIMAALQLEAGRVLPSAPGLPGAGKTVGLDTFYNAEWKRRQRGDSIRFHYTWEDTANSGFSLLGATARRLGARTASVAGEATAGSLNGLDVYIIVDPDTPRESAAPNYLSPSAIDAIEVWVRAGGALVLLGNDRDNAEFEHLNRLAERFGIHFNEDSHHRVVGNDFPRGTTSRFPSHPLFAGLRRIYTKEVSSLRLAASAVPLLADSAMVFMATARFGRGTVFAVGDPWLYNEYFDARKLPAGYDNALAAENLLRWLFAGPPARTGHP